ncbi:MAG: hypothetical protein K2N06_02040 [Oscillospiraceae bacterium]|nr:hypothetical protein [Oscillospiraceae bacterium]
MAVRPIFEVYEKPPFFRKTDTEFTFYSGFSMSQKTRCANSLHEAYSAKNPDKRVLEISGASPKELGRALSAFSLMITPESGEPYSVECAFQGSKVFERGGPFSDLIHKTSKEAKTDPRLRDSGKIVGFCLGDMDFPNEPKTFFYNWLYITTLNVHREFHAELSKYDAFTDIMFTPSKSFNCQAEAAAIFVSLYRGGKLEEALQSKECFLDLVYGIQS